MEVRYGDGVTNTSSRRIGGWGIHEIGIGDFLS